MGRLVCSRLVDGGFNIRAFDLASANFAGLPDDVEAVPGDPDRSKPVLNSVFGLMRRRKHACRQSNKPRYMGFDQRPICCLAAPAGIFDQGGLGPALRLRHGSLITRIAGERLGDLPIEQALLLGLEYLAHVEDVLDRGFLQFAHLRMHVINGRRDLGAIFMFSFHCLSQTGICGPQ